MVDPDILNASLIVVTIEHVEPSGPAAAPPFSPGPGTPDEDFEPATVPAGSLLGYVALILGLIGTATIRRRSCV